MKKGIIYREKVDSQQGYEDWEFTGTTHQSPSGVIYAMRNDSGVQWFSAKEIKNMKCQNKSQVIRSKRMKAKKPTKTPRPNPFRGADDIYLTKNKIAVTKTTNTSAKRSHKTVTQTKYYKQNPSNIRLLKSAGGGTVRVGRKGNNYKSI